MLRPVLLSLVLVLLALPVQAEPCRRGFFTADRFITTGSPESFTVGDFDSDGRLDVAVLKLGDEVYLLLNRAPGLFEPRKVQRFRSFGGQYLLQPPTDLDLDGHLDLIVRTAGYAHVAHGHGDGTFESWIDSDRLSGGAWKMADLNGDRRADFVDMDLGTLRVAPARTDGTFQTSTSIPIPGAAHLNFSAAMLTTGDVNGDGLTDVVAGGTAPTGGAAGYLFLNLGNLQFTTLPLPLLPFDPFDAAGLLLADVDADGKDEILGHTAGGLMVIRAADGIPRLEVLPDANPLTGFRPSAAADLDADGVVDVVWTNGAAAAVLWGSASGELTSTLIDRTFPGQLAVADVNGDGVKDLLAASSEGIVAVYGARGRRDLAAAPLSPAGAIVEDLVASDIDSDGVADLVGSSDSGILLMRGDGGGRFGVQAKIAGVRALAAADLDADGRPDLVVYGNSGVSVRFQDAPWSFGAPVAVSAASAAAFRGVAKLADGRTALLLQDDPVRLVTFDGRTPSANPLPIDQPNADQLVFPVDIDGDGDSDVLRPSTSFDAALLVQETAGWTRKDVRLVVHERIEALQSADMDGDGRLDLIVQDQFYPRVLLDDGNGSYTPAGGSAAGIGFTGAVRAADVDGDGLRDLVLVSYPDASSTGAVQIQRNAGGGALQSYSVASFGPAYYRPRAAVFFDADGDGAEDVVVATHSGIVFLRSICLAPLVRAALLPAVVTEGQHADLLVHAQAAEANGVGLITVRKGSEVLHVAQPNLAFDFGTFRQALPVLPPGEHVLEVEYADHYAGTTSTTLTLKVLPRSPRRRSVR